MKTIILSAFNGRLRSAPIEWPDEPLTIRMPLAQKTPFGPWDIGKDTPIAAHRILIGEFSATGMYEPQPGGRTAAIYELTGL